MLMITVVLTALQLLGVIHLPWWVVLAPAALELLAGAIVLSVEGP